MLTRLAYTFFDSIKEDCIFQQYKIGKHIRMPESVQAVVHELVGPHTVASESLKVPCGTVHVGDVVWLKEPTRLARARLAVRVCDSTPNYRYLIVAELFRLTAGGAWSASTAQTAVFEAGSVTGLCCHLIVGDKIFV
jgi:hypothetical protein